MNDTAGDWEFPAGFDYVTSLEQVKHFQLRVEEKLRLRLRLDDQVQDASFFAELFELEEGGVLPNGTTYLVFKIGIRFSTFGRMVTIHGNSPKSYPLMALIDLLVEHGFQYMDVESLNETYDGEFRQIQRRISWWDRFFDYS
jgi:hypothetical protein